MTTSLPVLLYAASTWVLPVLFAVTLHEAAHGFAAWRLGDDTAYRAGRLSLNPFRHVDPFGTVLLPALLLILRSPFLFGWAKPVPVSFGKLRHPRRDMVLVAAAGPGMNLALAAVSALLFHLLDALPLAAANWTAHTLYNSILLNLVLAVFNALPLPPLDGGRIAVGLLPAPLSRPLAGLEPYGLGILLAVVFLLPLLGAQLGYDLNVFAWIVGLPVSWLLPLFHQLAGLG
ncbi:MAG TPA: site-2 protease family protein [Alphaproteobacteria bacterium]|jgi:Zn-dependent protease|nr:site-2 protease family protein [Alphaproteobacteria bacterium]